MEAPNDFLNFVEALYFFVEAYGSVEGGEHFLFLILAGVLQGCPFIATLFVDAIEPFSG